MSGQHSELRPLRNRERPRTRQPDSPSVRPTAHPLDRPAEPPPPHAAVPTPRLRSGSAAPAAGRPSRAAATEPPLDRGRQPAAEPLPSRRRAAAESAPRRRLGGADRRQLGGGLALNGGSVSAARRWRLGGGARRVARRVAAQRRRTGRAEAARLLHDVGGAAVARPPDRWTAHRDLPQRASAWSRPPRRSRARARAASEFPKLVAKLLVPKVCASWVSTCSRLPWRLAALVAQSPQPGPRGRGAPRRGAAPRAQALSARARRWATPRGLMARSWASDPCASATSARPRARASWPSPSAPRRSSPPRCSRPSRDGRAGHDPPMDPRCAPERHRPQHLLALSRCRRRRCCRCAAPDSIACSRFWPVGREVRSPRFGLKAKGGHDSHRWRSIHCAHTRGWWSWHLLRRRRPSARAEWSLLEFLSDKFPDV